MSFSGRRVRAEPAASVFASPGQGDSGRLSVTQRCDRSSRRGHPRRRQPRSSPRASPARGPRPRPSEGEGNPRREPASGPVQNTPPPKNFFSTSRAKLLPFSPGTFWFQVAGPLGFPPLPSPSPRGACGSRGLIPERGSSAGTEEEGRGRGDEERTAAAREEELVKGDPDGRVPEKESDGAVCYSRNKVRALSSASRSLPSALSHSFLTAGR